MMNFFLKKKFKYLARFVFIILLSKAPDFLYFINFFGLGKVGCNDEYLRHQVVWWLSV
ncbi:hypothetical protein CLU79DRAFT_727063 [Phycomyces nitens]|nr:hypothetical protein CLU79DRAFT_727063 [Phycomyces nitens]